MHKWIEHPDCLGYKKITLHVKCGHIHVPEDKAIDDIHYINTGCWVEGCSFAYEKTGKLR
jgi:UDP-2,3-diacylglucosamine pyrophosphatase LpxH